jgi:adenylate cyclase
MPKVLLKKIIAKPEVLSLIEQTKTSLKTELTIQDNRGKPIFGDSRFDSLPRYPIFSEKDTIGWIYCQEQASYLAKLLSYISTKELQLKALAAETLEKYEEINFLYDISSKISRCLGVQAIANLIIEESQKLIQATGASVMLLNPQTKHLEIIAGSGTKYEPLVTLLPEKE